MPEDSKDQCQGRNVLKFKGEAQEHKWENYGEVRSRRDWNRGDTKGQAGRREKAQDALL